MKRALIALVIIGAIGAGAGAYYIRRGGVEPQVNTSPATRGDIVDTVGATGTLQAVTTVLVGSQVSGNISWLGADFNSIVHKGQVIARLDPSLFQAQVDQARANFIRAQADVVQAQANLERNKVAVRDAQQKLERMKQLFDRQLETQANLDAAKIAVESMDSQVKSSEAAVNSSRAVVVQAQANLNQAQVNLDHTTIAAPIDGIIIQRSVDVGQTVAASMQAPTLFIIAADLTKMQVNANIDEADVGRIRPGQTVTFRVDAYPTEDFLGTVAQVRLQPVVVQNVTTYGTIINVPNRELKLKPGMTANLKVQIAKRADVLRVPNAALRYRPTTDVFAAFNQPAPPEPQFAGGLGQGGRGRSGDGSAASSPQAAPAAAVPQHAPAPDDRASDPASDGGPLTGGDRRRGGAEQDGGDADRRGRMLERFKSMSPDEQVQFLDRMKARGQDTSAFAQAAQPAKKARASTPSVKSGMPQEAETIDALFAPLPPVESRGRAWLFINKELKPVNLRLGITDGTNTELLSGELQPGMEIVTGVILGGVRTTTTTRPGAGNPLMPNQRGGPGGFGGGGRGGR